MISEELWQAYRATSYEAETPAGRVRLRIGAKSPDVDRLLAENGLSSWAFVTAFNPFSKALTDTENEERHQRLLHELTDHGRPVYEGSGVPDHPDWNAETSVMILGIEREAAVRLAVRYGQNAIVFGTIETDVELVDCTKSGATSLGE